MALVNFYKLCIYARFIRFTDETISQLKNNGGLRLLRNKNGINKINAYYNKIVNIRGSKKALMNSTTLSTRRQVRFLTLVLIKLYRLIKFNRKRPWQNPLVQLIIG